MGQAVKRSRPTAAKKPAAEVTGPLTENDLTPRYQPLTDAATTNHIRDWRLYRGVKSHGELARMTAKIDPEKKGINRVTIARLENGVLRYNQGQIELIAKALDCHPGALILVNPNDPGDVLALYFRMEARGQQKAGQAIRQIARMMA